MEKLDYRKKEIKGKMRNKVATAGTVFNLFLSYCIFQQEFSARMVLRRAIGCELSIPTLM